MGQIGWRFPHVQNPFFSLRVKGVFLPLHTLIFTCSTVSRLTIKPFENFQFCPHFFGNIFADEFYRSNSRFHCSLSNSVRLFCTRGLVIVKRGQEQYFFSLFPSKKSVSFVRIEKKMKVISRIMLLKSDRNKSGINYRGRARSSVLLISFRFQTWFN